MDVSIHLADMLELGDDDSDLHVGLIPCVVNNQNGLAFNFSSQLRYMASHVANRGRPLELK